MTEVTGGNIYLEIGVGAKRTPGFGEDFPFQPQSEDYPGDLYATLDLEVPRGIERSLTPGPIVVASQAYQQTLREGPFNARTINEATDRILSTWELQRFAIRKNVRLAQLYGDGRELPFASGSVHRVLMREVIGGEDLKNDRSNQDQLLSEVRRVLSRNGAALICADALTSTPATESYLMDQFGWSVQRRTQEMDNRLSGFFNVMSDKGTVYIMRPAPLSDPYTAHAE